MCFLASFSYIEERSEINLLLWSKTQSPSCSAPGYEGSELPDGHHPSEWKFFLEISQKSIKVGFLNFSSGFCAHDTWCHNLHLNRQLFCCFCGKPEIIQSRSSLVQDTFPASGDEDPFTRKAVIPKGLMVSDTVIWQWKHHTGFCILLPGA